MSKTFNNSFLTFSLKKFIIYKLLLKFLRNKKERRGSVQQVVAVISEETRKIFEETWMDIWKEKGYDEEDLKNVLEYYRKYDNVSCDYIFYLKDKPAGTVRFIENTEEVVPPIIEEFKVEEEIDCETTLLTVQEEHRKDWLPKIIDLVIALTASLGHNVIGIAADEDLFKLLKKLDILNKAYQEKTSFHKGSNVIPVIIVKKNTKRQA